MRCTSFIIFLLFFSCKSYHLEDYSTVLLIDELEYFIRGVEANNFFNQKESIYVHVKPKSIAYRTFYCNIKLKKNSSVYIKKSKHDIYLIVDKNVMIDTNDFEKVSTTNFMKLHENVMCIEPVDDDTPYVVFRKNKDIYRMSEFYFVNPYPYLSNRCNCNFNLN